MPELPEVEVTCRALRRSLVGQKVSSVTLRQSTLRYALPPLPHLLPGLFLRKISRRGKYLLLGFAYDAPGRRTLTSSLAGHLLCHLGMSGHFIVHSALHPPEPERHDHVDIFFESALLRYRDPRRFGVIDWIPPEKNPMRSTLLAHLGLEPLAPECNASILHALCGARKTAIKNVLMNARLVVGIGNIYASEILFEARIDPFRPTCSLRQREWEVLVNAIQHVLQRAIAAGGSSVRDFVHPNGKPGYFQMYNAAYRQKTCPRCQHDMCQAQQSGRSTWFCPQCQR